MKYDGYKWYVGVTHCHTTASDGGLTLDELVKNAKKNKLDFVMITDHNVNCTEFPKVEGLTHIFVIIHNEYFLFAYHKYPPVI